MRTKIRSITLLVLFTLIATMAWAENVTLKTDIETGELYINFPTTGTDVVEIPDDVTEFRVYSDGGKDGYYSSNADGYLRLVAPEGRTLSLSGSVQTSNQHKQCFSAYDGTTDSPKLLDSLMTILYGTNRHISSLASSGNVMTLYFGSVSSTGYTGPSLTVTVNQPENTVSVAASAVGGSAQANKTLAAVGEKVTLTATPETGYMLSGATFDDGNGNSINVNTDVDWTSNILTFSMPNSSVTVTPTFTQDYSANGGLHLNMPRFGMKSIDIPASVSSFKVYEDGGKEGYYSTNSKGYLKLTAPEGSLLYVSGTFSGNDYSYSAELTIFDGDTTASDKLLDQEKGSSKNVGPLMSTGREITFYFRNNYDESRPGINVTVLVVSPRNITVVSPVTGGSAQSDKTQALLDETVTLTATPDANYLVKGVSLEDVNGNALSTNVTQFWYKNQVSFSMPNKDVRVTPVFTDDWTVAGGLYVNMPVTGTETVNIPDGVASFKVYDDGGSSRSYSANADGYLELHAPAGYTLRVEGKVGTDNISNTDFLTIYDGNAESQKLLDGFYSKTYGETSNIGEVVSSGNVMTLYFHSNDTRNDFTGLNLSVTLNPPKNISVASVSGGSVVSDKAQATYDELITLTVTPETGYMLSSVQVTDESGASFVLDNVWGSSVVTFPMPSSDITVTPAFTNEYTAQGGLFINMPVTGAKTVNISEEILSFKVYDDGGSSSAYSNNAAGRLDLVAPDGYIMLVSGSAYTQQSYDFLYIYDGEYQNSTLLVDGLSGSKNVNVASTGNTLSIYFSSDASSNRDGLDLTVTLINKTITFDVTIPDGVVGGTITRDPQSGAYGTAVTLSAVPDEGYILTSLAVTSNGSTVAYNDISWYNYHDVTFNMPYADVVVTPTFSNVLTAEEGLSVNVPASGTKTVNVPDGVTSFKVYDHAGGSSSYSNNVKGYLVINAPENRILQITGTVNTYGYNDYVTIYDGVSTSSMTLLGRTYYNRNVGTLVSSGNSVMIYFTSDGSNVSDGLDLTVTLLDATVPHAVSVAEDVAGGTLVANPVNAVLNTEITVSATPAEGFALTRVYVEKPNGYRVTVTGGDWTTGNTATFVMPYSDVTVTPVFTALIDNLSINMPSSGTHEIDIAPGITSFKVYDDGGSDYAYTTNAYGYLVLRAPEGYALQVTGTVSTDVGGDYLTIYDGDSDSAPEILSQKSSTSLGKAVDIGVQTSSANAMTLYFHSDNQYQFDGIDLTVKVIPPKAVSVALVQGGSVSAVSSAYSSQTVTLTATPDEGYVLDGFVAYSDGNAVDVNFRKWNNTATFVMPDEAVTVTPVFAPVNELFVNMPVSGTDTVVIPEGVKSFKVYDDGGSSANYSNNANGYVVLVAPEGHLLRVSGTLTAEGTKRDNLTIYDGSNSALLLNSFAGASNGIAADIGTVWSLSNTVKLYFKSDNTVNFAGLDLTVMVEDATIPYTVTLNSAEGGSMVSSNGAASVTVGTLIMLTATPQTGYILTGVSVLDADGNTVEVSGNNWYSGNVAQFLMPASNVTVTPVFSDKVTAEDGLYINMPVTGTLVAQIPENVVSFSVYDDGGADGNYSNNSEGYLELIGVDIKRFSANLVMSSIDYSDEGLRFDRGDGTWYSLSGSLKSIRNTLKLRFSSDMSQNDEGFEIAVTQTPADSVTVTPVEGGSVVCDNRYPAANSTVTLTITPAENYYLKGISVVDVDNNSIPLNGVWSLTNTVTFDMPYTSATVVPEFTNDLQAAGGMFVNMPHTGTQIVQIPAGIAALKVYDDGGADGVYFNNSNGTLELVAPEGYVLQLSGSMVAEQKRYDHLTISDGTTTFLSNAGTSTSGSTYTVGSFTSSGQSMTVSFHSDGSGAYAGLALDVTLINLFEEWTVTMGSYANGTISADPETALEGATVTLTAEPDENYVLNGITVVDGSGNNVPVSGGSWLDGVSTFVMPASNVTVTPTFLTNATADDGLYVNMPITGTRVVNIPGSVQSFKIYDDGNGISGDYSNNADGSIEFVAPEGYLLQVTGSMAVEYNSGDILTLYDGDLSASRKMSRNFTNSTIDFLTSGNKLAVSFVTNESEARSGLDLTVTVLAANTPHNITVQNVSGGSVSVTETSVASGTEVVVTATPNENYVLTNVNVVNSDGARVEVTGGTWTSGGVATFVMPFSDVTVTPVFGTNLTANDKLYLEIPYIGTESVTIPAGVRSFKVYDHGHDRTGTNDAADYYSNNADGYLELTAPEGHIFQVTGKRWTHSNDFPIIYDGINTSAIIYDYRVEAGMYGTPIGAPTTTGNTMTIYFSTNYSNIDRGLDFTVCVFKPSDEHAVSVSSDITGGTITPSVAAAPFGSTVSINVTPATGNLLSSIVAKDEFGNNMKIEGDCVFSGECRFKMPPSDVKISAQFTSDWSADGGLYVNMPFTGTQVVNIPQGVKSFKLYDDGGSGIYCTTLADGYLQLVAPSGLVFQVAGKVELTDDGDKLIAYDGADSTARTLLKTPYGSYNYSSNYQIDTLMSSQNVLTLHLITDADSILDDVDLTITLVDPSIVHTVTLSEGVSNGTASIEPSSAPYGTSVTMTMTPEEGYFLDSTVATDENGSAVPLTGGAWYSGTNVVEFSMPNSDVVVAPGFSNDLTNLYVNFPLTGKKTVHIPANVSTFKVYDDGGKDGKYTLGAKGTVELVAPAGNVLQISGVMVQGYSCADMYIYDGTSTSTQFSPALVAPAETGGDYTIGPFTSSGQIMTLTFTTSCLSGGGYDGLDLTVTLVPSTETHHVTINDAENGTMVSDNDEFMIGEVVTLTASPDDGYILSQGTAVLGCDDKPLSYSGGWYTGNQLTFVMPACDVTITPAFATEYFINIPQNGTVAIDVPSSITSFKVYDDGGSDANYSSKADGYLKLSLPEGYGVRVTGTVYTEWRDFVTIFDGDLSSPKLLDMFAGSTSIDVVGLNDAITFHLTSDNSSQYSGVNFTVTLYNKVQSHTVTLADGVQNGTISVDHTPALWLDTISVTVAPNTGYYLDGVEAFDEDGNSLKVFDGYWFTDNKATFVMPSSNVTVEPHFVLGTVTAGNEYVNLPVTGRRIVNIPEGVSTLHVYDDGGVDGNYSIGANGVLTLIAPEGYVLQVEGIVDIVESDYLALYNGDSTKFADCFFAQSSNFGSMMTSGRAMTVKLVDYSSDNASGFDLTVSLVAAADVPELTVADGGEVTVPRFGRAIVPIADGVNSFHVYDDGGSANDYSDHANGYLELIAPEGKVLQLSGNLETYNYSDKLTIFDGDSTSTKKFLNGSYGSVELGTVASSGRVVTLHFTSDYSNEASGFDFEVNVVALDIPYTVSVSTAENGSMDLVGENQFYFGDTVTLSAHPNSGYLLKSISVDANGKHVDLVEDGHLEEYGTARFVMPATDVTVIPEFSTTLSAEDGLFVTTPEVGHKKVDIPAGVTSFRVYDDGGAENYSSKLTTGVLELTAPIGYGFYITGSVFLNTSYSCVTEGCYNYLQITETGHSIYNNSTGSYQSINLGSLVSNTNSIAVEYHTNSRSTDGNLDMLVQIVYIGADYHVTFDLEPIKDRDSYIVMGHGDLWKNENLTKDMNSEENGAFVHLYEFFENDDHLTGFRTFKWSPVPEAEENNNAILASYTLTPAIVATASTNEDPLSINLYPSFAGSVTIANVAEIPVYAYANGNRVQEFLDYHGKLVLSQTLGGKDYAQKSFEVWAADDDDVDHHALYIPYSVDYGDTLVYDVSTEADPGYVMVVDGFVGTWQDPTGVDVQDPPEGEGWGYDFDTRTVKIAPEYMPSMEFKVHYELLPYNVTFDVPSSNSGVFVANEMANNTIAMDWYDSYTGLTMDNAPAPAVYNADGCRIAWKLKGRDVEVRENYELVEEIPFMISTADNASAVNALELDLQHPVCPNMDNGSGPVHVQTLQVDEGSGKLVFIQTVADTVITHEFTDNQMGVPVHLGANSQQEVGVTLKVVAIPDPGYVLKQMTYDMVVDGNNVTALLQDSTSVNVKQDLTWHVRFSSYEPVYVAYDLSLGAEDSSEVWLPANAAWSESLPIPYDGSATEMWKPFRGDRCFAGWTKDLNDADAPVYTDVDFMHSGEFSKNAAEPTMLYALWMPYGSDCSYPTAYVNIYPRYFENISDPSSYIDMFVDTLVVTQKLDNVVFTHKDASISFGTNPSGYRVSLDVLPGSNHELDTLERSLQVTMKQGDALVTLSGDNDGLFTLGSRDANEEYYAGYKDVTEYKVVLSTNAGDATVFYGGNWNTSAIIRIGGVLPDGSIARIDACFTGWSFDPDEPANRSFDYDYRRKTLGTSLLQQRAERLAMGLNVDTLYVKWEDDYWSCAAGDADVWLDEEISKNVTVALYQEVDGSDVKVLELGYDARVPTSINVSHGDNSYTDNVYFTKAVVTPKSGATLSDDYQLSFVNPYDSDEPEYVITDEPFTFSSGAVLHLQGLTKNTYNVVYHENAGDANVFYGENWSSEVSLTTDDVLSVSLFRADRCLAGWSFEGDQTKYMVADAEFIAAYEARVADGTSTDLYAAWSDDMDECGPVETVEVSLAAELKNFATAELIQTVGGEPKVVATVGADGLMIPKMKAVEYITEGSVIVVGENGYFSGIRIVPAPGYELVAGVNPSYKIGDADAVEVTDATPAWAMLEETVLSGAVAIIGYKVAYHENVGDTNVFYGENWSAVGTAKVGLALSMSLFRTDKCLAGWSFVANSSEAAVYMDVNPEFIEEYAAFADGDEPVDLYAVWSADDEDCGNTVQNVDISLSDDLKGVATVELIQTVDGEPKVVATVGENGILIPKMRATIVSSNEAMVIVNGENGYFSGLRVVPAPGYELVENVNPSYKIGTADAVEVTDATPAWLMTEETELSGAVAITGYTVTFDENGGKANVFYPADWSETESYNIVDNDGTAFPKLYRTDKCLVGYGFDKDASREQSFLKFDTNFVNAYDSVVAAGVASPVLYGVWNECTQALYKVTLNDIAEGTLVLSHNGKVYNVPSTGFVVPEATPALEFGLAFTPNLGYKLSDEGSFNLVNESGVIQSVVEDNTLAVDGDKIVDAPAVTLENTFAFVTNAGDAVLFYGDDWVESAAYSLDAQNVNFPKGIYRVDSCFTGWALNTESDRTHLQFNTDFLDDVEATKNAGLPVDRLYAIWGACETEQTIVTVANADPLSGTFTLSRTVSQTAKTYTVAGTALQVPADESLAFAVTFVPNKGYTYDETVGITAVDATDAPVSMNAGELVVATSLTLSAAATADTYTFALNENAGDANVFYTGSLATEFTAKVIDDADTRAIPMNLYRGDACLEGWNFSATAMVGFSQLDDEFVDAYNTYVAAGNEAPTTLYAVWNEDCRQTLYTVSSYDKRKGTLTLAQGSREFVVDTAGLKVPSVAGGLAFTATFMPAVGYDYDATQGLEAFNNMSQSMGVLTDGALTVTKTTVLKAVSLTASTYELAFNVNAGNATVYYGDAWRTGTEQTSFSLANAGDFPSDIYRTDSCLAGWTLSTSETAGIFTEFTGEFVDSVAAMDNFDGKLFAKWGNCIAVNNVTVAQVNSAAGTMTLKQTDAAGNVLNTLDIDDAEVTLPLGDGDVTFDVSFTVGEGYSLVDGDYFYTVNASGKNVQALLGNKLTLAGNTLLRAPVLSDAYTITFNTNAGDANVFYGAGWASEGQYAMEMSEVARTFPTEVYRVGYTLAGWSLTPAENSGVRDYMFNTDLATALKESGKTQVTLYAVWAAATSQQTYTITLADAAAGYLTASQTVGKTTASFRVGEEGLEVPAVTGGLAFDVTATMNAGYFADGEKLYLLAAGGARVDSLARENGELVVDGNKIVEIPYESDGAEFAFSVNTDAHVFYEDGWTGSGAFALNGDTAFPTGILRTEGKLLGWALSRTSTKYYTAYNGTFVKDLKNYKALGLPTGTLYAVWNEYGLFDNVNVTNGNDKNGSFVITQTVNGVETEPITVNADGIQIPYSEKGLTFNVKFETKPGYYFNAEQAISGANAAGASIGNAVNGGALVFKSNTDVVLSASVDANRLKFNYNVNGGDAYVFYGSDWSSTGEKSLNDTSLVFPANIYRNDACLQGWSIDPADSTGSTLLTSDFIATLDRVQNVNTLYAVWKECEVETYTVTFENTNVGSLVLSQDVDDSLVTFAVAEDGLKVPVVPGGLRFRAAYTLNAGYAGNTDTLYVVDDITGILTTLADNALTVNENITLAIPTVGETFKLVFDVNREGRLFYGSDWIDSAIYMLSDKKSVIPLPNYVYTSEACMVGWSVERTGGETYLKFNTDLAAALLENKSADSTYKLYAIWGKGTDCDDLYDRVTFTGNHGTVHLAEAPRGDKTEFIEHEFMSDGTMILPKTMNGNYIRVFAVPDSSYMLDSLVMTRNGSDEERQVFFEGDALVYNLMDAQFEAFFGKSNRTEVAFVKPMLTLSGNAMRFSFTTSMYEITRKVGASVRLETIDGELVDEADLLDSIVPPYNGKWEKFPLAAGRYVLKATIGDDRETDVFDTVFDIVAEIAAVSENAWQMISIGNLDKDAMVWDGDAIFYWWDEASASGEYWQYREYDPNDDIVPTRGYWYSSIEGRPLVLKAEVEETVADKVEWKLDNVNSGWNLVANPYGFALNLYGDHPAENVEASEESGVTFWSWNPEIADYEQVDVVSPYGAVWVKVTAPTDWTIPVAPRFDTDNPDSEFEEDSSDVTLKALAKARRLTKANGKNDWRLQMVLSDAKGHKDSWNMLGASHNAFTTEEPPEGMGDHVKLSIVEGNRMLAKSVKAPAEEQDWKIALSANSERYGELSFKGVDDINALGLKVFVTVDGKTTEMHDGMTLRVLLKSSATKATVRVAKGPRVVADLHIDGLRSVQSGSSLNVSFVASADLAGTRTVVEILNMDGKVIASRSAKTLAGTNAFAFDAPRGGIYLLRVRAGSQIKAGRIMVR
ncbi:MAG: hypothetical protein J5791_01955 [Fibrobacter sp.]|nr:hypothetical protein [Fibrobacter sp.]